MDNIKPSTIDGVHTNLWDPRLNYAGSMWVVLHDTFFFLQILNEGRGRLGWGVRVAVTEK